MIKIISADLKKIRAVNTLPLDPNQRDMLLHSPILHEEVFNKLVDHTTVEDVYEVKLVFTTNDTYERKLLNVYESLFEQDKDSDRFLFTSYNKIVPEVKNVIDTLRNKSLISVESFVNYIEILISTLD